MSNSFFMSFGRLILLLITIILFSCFFFIPIFQLGYFSLEGGTNDSYSFMISNDEYVWPTPGYTSINSYFGKRYAPTNGASSYHKGIDIGAPQGSKLIAVTSGQITFTGFFGGGGYTITLTNKNMKFTYCHVSPHYIVKEGDIIEKGDIIRVCWTQERIRC